MRKSETKREKLEGEREEDRDMKINSVEVLGYNQLFSIRERSNQT